MRAFNKRLTLFTDEVRSALYDLPEFDESMRAEYLLLTKDELDLVYNGTTLRDSVFYAHIN